MARSEEEKGFERRMVKERSKVIDAFVDKVQQKELERERRLGLAREKAAQIWCQPETEECVMDVAIAQAFAEVLVEEMYTPRLGCATTGGTPGRAEGPRGS